jgi:sulfur relay (sulfurtransferase) complex TusBCD TusD component (DsrE family)
MAEYVLIESRDPFEFANVGSYCRLAASLAKAGNKVTLFLVQNGVLQARIGAKDGGIAEAAKSGVTILAEEFSLRERGIGRDAHGRKENPDLCPDGSAL